METRVCRLHGKEDLRIEREPIVSPESGEVLVRVMRGGICGSDLHYYLDGGFGPIRVREPIIIGHEFAGYVEALGQGVEHLEIGDRVAVNPSLPCGECLYCREGSHQHCINMRFTGSALLMPHEQGGFREWMTVSATQCVKGGETTDYAELACAEPLAVCLHAARQADDLRGKRVLVNGAGPIGAICAGVVKFLKAEEIVVIDLFDKTLEVAAKMGADHCIDLNTSGDPLEHYSNNKGYFDIVFECSAAQTAIDNVFKLVRPQGALIQVGVTGSLTVPINVLVGKEIRWMGTHRFHEEYEEAVSLISHGKIDVAPVVTDIFPLNDVHGAMEAAADRSRSVKVQIAFG